MLGEHLIDVGRALDPDNEAMFSWWAPWRNMRQRNIGWRLDYVMASETLHAESCVVRAEVGTSDHAPVVATFEN
jgi:exodeoxyribonuclease-3